MLFALTSTEYRMTKKFEIESEEENKKISDSYNAVFDNINQEKEVTQPKAHQWLNVRSKWDIHFPSVPLSLDKFRLSEHISPFPASGHICK